MAVKQIDYKINFTASDKQLSEVLNNLKSLTGKNGINLTDAMRGNLQKIEAMWPAYKEKLNKVLNSSQFNPFDVKALNNDIKTIGNTIRNLFISISKQVLPKSISDQIDEIDDNLLRNARLTGNPIPLIAKSSCIDPEKVTNVPGQAIPTNDINGMKWLEPPTLSNYLITKRADLINNDRPIVSRFSDQMIGKQQNGIDTATESLALQNSAK